jgi:hypothetical protein
MMTNSGKTADTGLDMVGGNPGAVPDPDLERDGVAVVRDVGTGQAYFVPAALRHIPASTAVHVRDAQLAVRQQRKALDDLDAAVAAMRRNGLSWNSVGWVVGTSAQAARQRWMIPEEEAAASTPRQKPVKASAKRGKSS